MLKNILCALIGLLTLAATSIPAEARIDILPRLVKIDARERSAELTLLNLSDNATAFRIDTISIRQDEYGVYTQLETPLNPLFSPEKHVKFSPRQFILPPRGRQKVRISLRKPKDLPDGEYRFHIRATEIPHKEDTPKDSSAKGASVSININLSVSIPVIIRHGKTEANTTLSNISILPPQTTESGRPQLKFDLNRSGTESIIGELSVFWQTANTDKKRIGYISNFNVFTDVDVRHTQMNLREFPQGEGALEIIIKDSTTKEVINETVLK